MQRAVVTKLVKSLILTFILVFAARLENAYACMEPHQRTFPTCEISAPRSDERTTIVYANGGSALSSVTPGIDAVVTEVVDIEIGVADKPHYIVLSSGRPIIWRFTGRIDAISRIVVLGSQYNGATRSGVVGVPPDRIVFAKTDMEKLKNRTRTSCDSFYSACEASAYFEIPKAARMQLAGDAPSECLGVDQFVERLRGGVIRIPQDGWVEAEARGQWQTGADGWTSMSGPALGRYEPFGGTGYVETSQTYERGLINIEAASVISPETVRDYSVLPAIAGIRQLLADGSLVSPDDARFKAAYDKWNEDISRPYRSKFDQNFLFSYKVNYLTARPMKLPAGVNRIALLVGEGVEAPDMNGNYYEACLYYADLRDVQLDPRKFRDPRCDVPPYGNLVLSDSERSIALMARSLGRLQQASQADKAKCRRLTIASDAYFAGIAVSEDTALRTAGPNASRRRVDVIVKRPGNVALYLEMWGRRASWHILPSENTQITNVLLGELTSEVRGVSPSIPVQTIVPSIESGCSLVNPSRIAHLGGPAALKLDQDLQVLAGHGLDTLLRNTNDGSWPPVVSDQDAPRVTLVIE
jgi:hypothetical protein